MRSDLGAVRAHRERPRSGLGVVGWGFLLLRSSSSAPLPGCARGEPPPEPSEAEALVRLFHTFQGTAVDEATLAAATAVADALLTAGYDVEDLRRAIVRAFREDPEARDGTFQAVVPRAARRMEDGGGAAEGPPSGDDAEGGGGTDEVPASEPAARERLARESAAGRRSDGGAFRRRAALLAPGIALLGGGMAGGVASGMLWASTSNILPGGEIALGAIPVAGPIVSYALWQSTGYRWSQYGGEVALVIVLTAVEATGAVLVVAGLAPSRRQDRDAAARHTGRRRTWTLWSAPLAGGGALGVCGRF